MTTELPHRHVTVTFTLADGNTKTIDGLNIKFSARKMCYAFGGQASVSIANLTSDDIIYLTTFLSPFMFPNKKKKIAIFAGYDDDVKEIFSGDIWTALPVKRGADIWLDIRAIKSFFNSGTMTSKTLVGDRIKTQEICNKVAGWAGLSLNWKTKSNKTVDTFSFTGSITDAIRKLSTMDNILVYEDEGALNVIDANPQESGTRLISEDSGMIGMPRINHFGVEAKILLDNSIKLGETIELKSKLVPSANGKYIIYSITHQGSLRETEFYSILKCRRGNLWL